MPSLDTHDATPAGPTLVIPDNDQQMATQPAEMIAKATTLKNAGVTILAVAGYAISPQLDGALDTALQALITLGLIVYGMWTAQRQGQETKQAVFSPASTVAIAELAASRGNVHVITDDEHAPPKVV